MKTEREWQEALGVLEKERDEWKTKALAAYAKAFAENRDPRCTREGKQAAAYEDALRWVWSELEGFATTSRYEDKTLIANVRDRVAAALKVGPYAPREP
jgi:hypothetical protein